MQSNKRPFAITILLILGAGSPSLATDGDLTDIMGGLNSCPIDGLINIWDANALIMCVRFGTEPCNPPGFDGCDTNKDGSRTNQDLANCWCPMRAPEGATCVDGGPTGACCVDGIECVNNIPESVCESGLAGDFHGIGVDCSGVTCAGVPTANQWGITVLALMILTAGTIAFTGREARAS